MVKNLFCFFNKVEKSLKSTSLYTYIFVSFSFFLFVGVLFNTYAVNVQGSFKFSTTQEHQNEAKLAEKSQGFEGATNYVAERSGALNFFIWGLDTAYPRANQNFGNMASSNEISEFSKLGLVGMLDVPFSAMMYNPPNVDISEHLALEWIPNYDSSGGVYAETGYQMLLATPVVNEFWGVTRNIAYMLFVVVFIVAGFMIMFRHKLGGQTMVTIYNTLPNIIVGLILVTFSFAIVGFLMNIGALLINVIAGEIGVSSTVDVTQPLGVAGTYFSAIGGEIIGAFTQAILSLVLGNFVTSGVVGLMIAFFVVVIIYYASIKIFFALIKAYIGIIFDTIAAPIIFAFATIPGKQSLMKDWFNRVIKNVLVFVLVFFLVNLPLRLVGAGEFTLFGGDLRGDSAVSSAVLTGISIYLLFLAANVPKMLEEYLPSTSTGSSENSKSAGQLAKAGMSKIPVLGNFFKG